jgi:hypothetical protein
MHCPHCQKELPESYGPGFCPFCSKDLPPAPGQKISWPFFFVFLFSPVLLTIITVRLNSGQGDSSATVAFWGAVVSGIGCGMMLARRLGETTGARIMLAILLIPLMGVVCLIMNCFGCLASGATLNIH